jgi:eukaryotic translation initiation factor 2C
VDDVVTDKHTLVDPVPNFYLLSHSAFQGTARPAHYHVILDEMNWNDLELKKFIFAQTCLHQGCNRPLSYPAPVFFADRLAERAHKCYFNKEKDYWSYFPSFNSKDLQEVSWNTFSKSLDRPIMI